MSSFPGTPNATNPNRASKMNSQAVNLNHLLNFTLPPRQAQPLANLPRRSRRTGTQQVWNKERFINAQYRFVMNPVGDYTVHFADPDIFFQWNDILQVIIPRASALASAAGGDNIFQGEGHTTCPICLSPPTASRMTKCGHVYCYPCILHYLSTSEKGWARCPICFDSINDKQLKNVKWFDGPTCDSSADDAVVGSSASSTSAVDNLFEAPRTGSTMRLRLMQRPQITTLALPRSQTWPSDLILPHQAPFHFLPDVFNFSKFMLATPDYLIADLSNDLDELTLERRTLAGMNDDLGISFVDSAEQKVRNQISRANAMDNPILREQIDRSRQALRDVEDRQALYQRRQSGSATSAPNDVPEELLSIKTGASLITPSRPSSVTRSGPKQRRNLNPPPPSTSTYYYYQAASGLPIYLHPLDIRILLSHFSSYPAFPDTIDIRVEAFSEGTVNEDLRKRCKYLAHMPEGADVVFIEADLTGVLGLEGLKSFDGPLKMRTSRRKDKIRKDDRARTRADERERERRLVNTSSWSGPTAQASVVWQSEPDSPVQAQVYLPPVQVSGAWGARSFASTLQSAGTPGAQRDATQRDEDDEWDIDAAWHELETRNGNSGSGRRKKSNKLVLIGGGVGPGRRR